MKNEKDYHVTYVTLEVEAARTGWIVRQKGKPTEIFVRWESVVNHLKKELTSGGLES